MKSHVYIRVWLISQALFAFAAGTPAESIRVTSWNLSPRSDASAVSAGNRLDVADMAAELKRLEPDVILLQHVPDYATCARLAQALKPSDYKVTVCSSFGLETDNGSEPGVVTNKEELKLAYESQLREVRVELGAAEKELTRSRAALGAIGKDLVAQGITNWSEVTPDRAKEYGDTATQIDIFMDQERDLRRRGYKEAHPLVQAVRTQLRMFSSRKAELERNFPTLRYIVVGTNEPNWFLARQLDENRSLNSHVATLQGVLKSVQEQLSKLVFSRTTNLTDGNRSGAEPSERSQVAILARQNAYFSLSHVWVSSNNADFAGFAFSAIQTSKQNVGLFSVDFGSDLPATGSVHQLIGQISSIRKWEQNQVGIFLVACTFTNPTKRASEEREQTIRVILRAGLSDALAGLAAEPDDGGGSKSQLRSDWMLVESTGLALNPQATASRPGFHWPVTCDIELDPAKVAAGRLARVEAQTSGPFRELQLQPSVPLWPTLLLFAAVCFLSLGWIIGRSKGPRLRKSGLLPVRKERGLIAPSSYTVIVTPTSMTGSAPDPAALPPVVPTVHVDTPGPGPTQSGAWEKRALAAEHRATQAEAVIRQGLLPHLSRWMREKLLRKLLVDRSQLLAAQEEATRKVMAVDARLNKLELQIQQQTRVYVQRIEELTAELLAAKEENRELIRAKIAQVKIEMEAARKKVLDQENNAGGG